ncbi:GAF domain-containing protein [Motilibacter rhizosphaerae]|uniref:GAF domain-containing protein n=1 Tax=Motilibacter rhizosphaerae TaxID=598652 RepID=A0A4Q7NW39_9ACTN|nr:GAF domain-containing protein [Motilibacter rhizosphaerae]RZS91108.1 GAF domain-containing protein [Motilibacter rhizosphaerae]
MGAADGTVVKGLPASVEEVLGDPARLRAVGVALAQVGPLREQLDAVAERTAFALDAPVSLVTLVLDAAVMVVGTMGVDEDDEPVPAELAMCPWTVQEAGPYVVEDAAAHPVHGDNPLLHEIGLAAYAGVPLVFEGRVVGAHCVQHDEPHAYTPTELAVLERGAAEIAAILQAYAPV